MVDEHLKPRAALNSDELDGFLTVVCFRGLLVCNGLNGADVFKESNSPSIYERGKNMFVV